MGELFGGYFADMCGEKFPRPEKFKVFKKLTQINEYADSNGVKLNYKKTKLMHFNPVVSRNVMPS